ncbi:MAG: hypothetical protein ABFD54_01765 [Armatimonadota bacterium]|nr:hypothetical protein [bacterium]
MRRSHGIAAGLCGLFLIATLCVVAVRINAGVQPKSVRLIYTNDTLGYAEPCG